ncbi:MAG TPA: NAD(P)-dependent oxidoreductase [Candidatus Elarobacter sp.]
MAVIAYFGTGLLGAGFVRKMLERGETVHVWNRTAEKAKALEADGAKAFATPAEAARGADEIHLTLSDDAAVDAVLEPLADLILPTAFIADHTTTAPTPTGERYVRWKQRGKTFVHAPVFMGPQQAREGTGFMMISGDPDVRARVKPRLAPMTGKLLELGDDPARAAGFKLFGNMMLLVISAGLADTYKLSRSLGIDTKDAWSLFTEFNPGNAILGRGKSMAEGNYKANFELAMARKDLRLMTEEAARHGAQLDVVPAVAALFDKYIAAGHGSEDVGAIAAPLP